MKRSRRTLRWTAAVALSVLGLTLGLAAGVSTASDGAGNASVKPCDPDTCQPPPPTSTASGTTTAPTTGTTSTTPGGGGSTQCSDGRDNDGDRLVDLGDPACSGPQDDDESDDPALDSFVGAPDTQFARLDEGVVGTDGFGASIRCAWVGAERSEHGIAAKGWSFFMKLRWCWNGRTVVSWTSWDKWVQNHIPFPVSLIYPLDWRILSESTPAVGVFQTSAFAQAKVTICPVKAPVCFTWYPWLRFTFDAQGHALCQSDSKTSIPDCKA